MKKSLSLLVGGILLTMPLVSLAQITSPLSYGSRGEQVTELQEFLISNNYLQGTATGNFFSLTLAGVKAFQSAHNIPNTGYVGVLTRTEINNELATSLASSTSQELQETGTTTAPTTSSSTAMEQAQAYSAELSSQIQAQLDAADKMNALTQQLQVLTTTLQNSQATTTATSKAPLTLTVNQPVCVNASSSKMSVDTDWTQVQKVVLSWTGGLFKIGGNGFNQGSSMTWPNVGVQDYTAIAYDANPDGNPLAQALVTTTGVLTFPDCSNTN